MASSHHPRRGSFEFLEAKIRRAASGTSFGKDFEWVCKWFLENAPQYRGKFRQIVLWDDWPDRWGPDCGIDLIAETHEGELWAIQAKACSSEHTVSKREIDSFLSESSRPQIKYRLLIASTDDLGKNARRTIEQQEKHASLLLRGDLLASGLTWPSRVRGKAPKQPVARPKTHQRAAIKSVISGFKDKHRGQLIMACGTGKTLTGLWINEAMNSRQTLLLVPSISLVQQNLHEWGRNAKESFDCLVVCSDETVRGDRTDAAVQHVSELGIDVTTNPKQIAAFLKKRRKRPAVVISTYHSSDRVSRGQQHAKRWFDLTLCDEAHRLTGDRSSAFATVLDEKKIRSRKRLFMTATPRYFTERAKRKANESELQLASMDDEQVFGPEFHILSFREAIEAKPKPLLTEYQVAIIGVTSNDVRRWIDESRLVRTKEGVSTDAKQLASQIGLAKAITKYGLRRIITFHRTVKRARDFVDAKKRDALPAVIAHLPNQRKRKRRLWARHISGETPASTRRSLLIALQQKPEDTIAVLSNCACLKEGVDVKSLDGIAFIDPRSSMVDIIQAVGRVIRLSPDKQVGTIVLPVFIDESQDVEAALACSTFKHVWQVIRALRAHDSRLADHLDKVRLSLGVDSGFSGGDDAGLPPNIHAYLNVNIEDFAREFFVRTVAMTTDRPALTIQQVLAWADEYFSVKGSWPSQKSKTINRQCPNWKAIDQCLIHGLRGLPKSGSLHKLLRKTGRKAESHLEKPDLSEAIILEWCDKYFVKYDEWPQVKHKRKVAGQDASWASIDAALRSGGRGLAKGKSLAKLLFEKREVETQGNQSRIEILKVTEWIRVFESSNKRYPSIEEDGDERIDGTKLTWRQLINAVKSGSRGLPKQSWASFLESHFDKPNRKRRSRLTVEKILEWGEQYFEKHGKPPTRESGKIPETLDTWKDINNALNGGLRGLEKGDTLFKLFKSLTEEKVWGWIQWFYNKHGSYPTVYSQDCPPQMFDSWRTIDAALRNKSRGLLRDNCSLSLFIKLMTNRVVK